jgi:type IV pilus assembly protein PilY1
MTKGTWLRASAALVVVALLVGRSMGLFAANNDYEIAQTPLFNGQVKPPLMMMVLSRDERLFTKAYSDYTDLNGDGVLDTTYKDTFNYSGYFDPKLCYTHDGAKFKAAAAAGGANEHSCNVQWSGNFLNWITMSRLDVLRYVLYGGTRSTDSATQTILERAHIPNDLHAWVKTYSGADIAQFMPNPSASMSFCSRSASNTGLPQMRVAKDIWSEWASSSTRQCMWDEEATGDDDASKAIRRDSPARQTTLTVRVEVCDPAAGAVRESFCAQYGTTAQKPVGLLQTFGESGRLRFGLVSGSYSAPRSGGVLRKPIGLFAGNGTGCTAGNEVDTATGQLCKSAGIVATLDNYKLDKWNGWTSNSSWSDCNTYSIYNRQGFGDGKALNNPGTGSYNCSAWGNPVAEMYAEALRYIAGETAATSTFVAGTDLANLPSAKWEGQDPYRSPASGGNSYCAACNILVMSSSLPSFDSDEIPDVPRLGSAADATNAVGLKEGITGDYPVGRVGETPKGSSIATHEDTCGAKSVTSLGLVRGICPDSPSTEGSYLMAGLAYKANTTDLRPGLQGKPPGYKNTVTTYAVALADNLPKFEIPVGGGKITLSPLCQANNSGSAKINDGGWRTCFLGSVGVDKKLGVADNKGRRHEYGRPLRDDGKAGSFSLVWEDSLWGNDYDNDVVAMMTYCVGTTCEEDTNPTNNGSYTGDDICWRSDSNVCGANGSPNVGENEVLVRIENLSAYAGNAMLTGFAVSGSNADGLKRLALRPGGNDGSVLTDSVDPVASWGKPKVLKFTLGASAKQLESPLWYAAKYGGFKDVNDNGEFDQGVDEWDTKDPGTPDNYFFARDPSKLKEELEKIFEKSSAPKAPTTGGGGGSRVSTDSFTLEASYELTEGSGNDWKGDVQAFAVKEDGSEGAEIWSAAGKLATRTDRNVIMVSTPTQIDADDGAVTAAVAAAPFVSANIVGTDRIAQLQWLGMTTPIPTWFTGRSVDDFVGYIKGSSAYELRNGGKLRSRSSPMGDIINSTSEIVSPLDNYGYSYWSSFATPTWRKQLGDSYTTFLKAKATRESVVYVGANDGMLHGFETSKLPSGGRELFAFIPSESRKNLAALLDPNYAHRYYVDGNLTSADVPFTATGDWRSVLVGAMGAGGRSVFALDVSNPSGFDEDDVLWELSGAAVDDVGYVMGKPVVVPIRGTGGAPRWVAMFGNGANSNSGAPVLFVVDIKTGEVLAQLKPSGASYAERNGLMNIAPVSLLNNDGMVDTVYGGDLQGNLWKFDLSDESPGSWEVAFNDEPLFSAVVDNVAQPITGGIEVSSGPGGGVSIFFGTGRYFAVGDEVVGTDPPVQSLYGIWDNLSTTRVTSRSMLVEQTISAGTTSAGYQTRNVSNNPVNYGEKRGWFIDLKVGILNKGERFIGTPRIQNGRVIFTTYEAGDATCSAGGGTNWLYAVNLLTGSGSMSGITVAPGGDSVCTGNCGGVALKNQDGRKTSPPVRDTSIFVPPPKEELCNVADPGCIQKRIEAEQCTFVLRAAGAEPLYLPRPCGRQSWRQVR